MNISVLSITPRAIQDLLDELESSKQSRLRAWTALQRIRAILAERSSTPVDAPSERNFEAEGAILERLLTKCLHDREVALKELADAARRLDKASFSNQGDFARAHQALLRALDRVADVIRT
jgi:hypothetical protein